MTVSGGLGYSRTPALVNVWASAPFLHNNSVGAVLPVATPDQEGYAVSIEGRLAAFQLGMQQLLNPETRQGLASIRRTTHFNKVFFPEGRLCLRAEGHTHRCHRKHWRRSAAHPPPQ